MREHGSGVEKLLSHVGYNVELIDARATYISCWLLRRCSAENWLSTSWMAACTSCFEVEAT